mgnify:CR=1 FL=1
MYIGRFLLFIFGMMAVCGLMVLGVWTSIVEKEEKAVPFTIELEQLIKAQGLPYLVVESGKEERDSALTASQKNILTTQDRKRFLNDVSSIPGTKETIHKTFLDGEYQPDGTYRTRARHSYWTQSLDKRLVLEYEVEYTPPPISLESGGEGSFKRISEGQVVFGYAEMRTLYIGAGIASGLFALAFFIGMWVWERAMSRHYQRQNEVAAQT